ncbi:MAG: Ig-like domain-containing protein [Gemmatimonadota bacterium]
MRTKSCALLGLGLVAVLVGACEEPTRSPAGLVANLAPTIMLPSTGTASGAPIAIDGVRIRVVRPPSESVLDTLIPFPPTATSLNVRLRVQLKDRLERLTVTVELLVGSRPYYAATAPVDLAAEGSAQPTLNLTYVGPGAAAQTVRISPRDTTVTLGDLVQMRVAGFDAAGTPLTELLVTWSTSSSAIVIAADGSFTAPGSPGQVRVRAVTPTGIADSTTVFFASATPSSLAIASGNSQTGTVGTTLAQPLQALVRGGNNVPLAGATVLFRSLSGGSVTTATATTNAQGIAQTGATLGTLAGPQSFEASVVGLTPVTFGAIAQPASAAAVTYVSGGGQIGAAGLALPGPLTARVTDGFGNPVPGMKVNWSVAVGTGSLASSTNTNAVGITTNAFTLGGGLGRQTAAASISAAPNTPALFTEIAQSGPANQLFIYSGNPQSLNAPNGLNPLVVRVSDAFGNPAIGATVTWTLTAGIGNLSPPSSQTDSTGIASVVVAPQSVGISAAVRATIVGGASVTFNLPSTTTVFQMRPQSSSVPNLTAGQGTPAAVVTAIVTDGLGTPWLGQPVSWSVLSGGGSVNPPVSVTGSFGDATTTYTSGTRTGVVVVESAVATAGVTTHFTVRVFSAPATTLAIFSGDAQTARAGTTAPLPLRVLVLDAFGNLVPGGAVTWTALDGGSVLTPVGDADPLGIAATQVTLGSNPGVQRFRATCNGGTVVFTLRGT